MSNFQGPFKRMKQPDFLDGASDCFTHQKENIDIALADFGLIGAVSPGKLRIHALQIQATPVTQVS